MDVKRETLINKILNLVVRKIIRIKKKEGEFIKLTEGKKNYL